MSGSLRLGIATSPFERVAADVAIAGFFGNERPLRGAAGRADWRLCGLVSDRLADGHLREKTGAAVLVPALGRLAADRVLLVGLGRRANLGTSGIHRATSSAVRRGVLLGARRLALEPPTGDENVAHHAGTLLRGALAAVTEASADVELQLVTAESEAGALWRALEEALEAEPSPEVRLLPRSRPATGPAPSRGVPAGLQPFARVPSPGGR